MPDLEEPLWSKRLRASSQKDGARLDEMRARDGRAVSMMHADAAKEKIDSSSVNRVGRATNRSITKKGIPTAQYRASGSGKAQRDAAGRTMSAALDRIKADASTVGKIAKKNCKQ